MRASWILGAIKSYQNRVQPAIPYGFSSTKLLAGHSNVAFSRYNNFKLIFKCEMLGKELTTQKNLITWFLSRKIIPVSF